MVITLDSGGTTEEKQLWLETGTRNAEKKMFLVVKLYFPRAFL